MECVICPHCDKKYPQEDIFLSASIYLEFYPNEESYPHLCETCGKDLNLSFSKGVFSLKKD